MSQISEETELKIIELMNNTSVSRLADSRASALCHDEVFIIFDMLL